MSYKKTKEKMSREELENRVEWMTVEVKRTEERYARLRNEYDMLYATYMRLPKWMRRLAERRYDKICRRVNQ